MGYQITDWRPGDSTNVMLGKLLQKFGASAVDGNGLPVLLRKMLESASAAASGVSVPLNFKDSVNDAVVYHTGGTSEALRVRASDGFIELADAYIRIVKKTNDGSLTFLGGTVKSDGAFIEFTGQNHPTNPGFAGITFKSGSYFRVLSAPNDSFSSTTRLTLDANGDLTIGGVLSSLNVQHGVETIVYGASVGIDFSTEAYKTVSLTGDIEFTTSNLAAGRSVSVHIVSDGTPRSFTLPAGWKFIGDAAPASIAANKVGVLSLTAFGTTDSTVVAAYAEEP